MTMLEQEIREQPEALERFLDHAWRPGHDLVGRYRRHAHWVLIAARGSSDNAARYAQYALGALAGVPVALATPSLLTRYRSHLALKGCLVIGISQSGRSPDIVAVVEAGRRQGQPSLGITNDGQSPLARAAEDVLLLHTGPERSVAATKTYTAQLACLALLAAAWGEQGERLEELRAVPELVLRALHTSAPLGEAARRVAEAHACVTLGRGYNYATAFELALKLKELAYLLVEPYSPADFRHGPVALVEEGFPVVAIAPHGAVYDDQRQLLAELSQRRAHLTVISDGAEALALADHPIPLPRGTSEWLSPLPAIALGQLLALHLTLARGLDPDHPRGLGKVTLTE